MENIPPFWLAVEEVTEDLTIETTKLLEPAI